MDDSVLPGYLRAKADTARSLDEIEGEFGLFSSAEITARGIDPASLLWVRRDEERLYPGFQVTESGEVPPVIHRLAEVADEVGWSSPSITFWLCSPSGSFRGDRPIDHMNDEQFIAITKTVWESDW